MEVDVVTLLTGTGPAVGVLVVVLFLVVRGRLVPGSTHDEAIKDRDFYRDKWDRVAGVAVKLLEHVEIEEESDE